MEIAAREAAETDRITKVIASRADAITRRVRALRIEQTGLVERCSSVIERLQTERRRLNWPQKDDLQKMLH
jgi:aminoglycoside phosphotransferase